VRKALAGLAGVADVTAETALPGRVTLTLDNVRPAEVVTALVRAGVPVSRVAPRRRLEDAFLALIEEG
jgi:ABC-2 type transport system ATP-binding protein